jgi:hypothetical protein
VVLLAFADGFWVGLGSDHTDRAMEAHGVALGSPKQPTSAPASHILRVSDHPCSGKGRCADLIHSVGPTVPYRTPPPLETAQVPIAFGFSQL